MEGLMDPKDAQSVVRILQKRGISTQGLDGQSPWVHQTPKAELIQGILREEDPELAQRLAQTHLGAPSLELMAAEAAGTPFVQLPAHLQKEWAERNPVAYRDHQRQVIDDQLRRMEEGAAALKARNTQAGQESVQDAMMRRESAEQARFQLMQQSGYLR